MKVLTFYSFLIVLLYFLLSACSNQNDQIIAESGKSIISGSIPDTASNSSVVSISFTGEDFRNAFLSETIDSSGYFRFEITIPHPQVIYLRSIVGILPVYISPGDSLLINLNPDSYKNGLILPLNISGNNPKTSINIREYLRFYDPNTFFPEVDGKSVGQYLTYIKKNMQREDSILSVFIKTYQPTDQFKTWAYQDIIYHNANFLEEYKFYHFTKNSKFTGNLYNTEYFPVNNDRAIVSISYYTYLWNYSMNKYIEKDTTVLNLYKKGALSEAYNICFKEISENERKGLSRDLMIYSLTTDVLNRSKKEFFKLYSTALDYINNESLKSRLIERKALTEKQTDFSISQLDGSTQQEKEIIGDFFSNLISTYPDKVLYIDLWAVWCGPCRKEFLSTPAIHDYFKNKPVAFINLCLSSDRSEWIKAVKDLKISGENYYFDETQSGILRNKLKYTGLPTYLVVDKKGDIITKFAPRPSEREILIKLIDDLITK